MSRESGKRDSSLSRQTVRKKSLEKSQKVFGSLINLLTFAAALRTKQRSSDKLMVRNE